MRKEKLCKREKEKGQVTPMPVELQEKVTGIGATPECKKYSLK